MTGMVSVRHNFETAHRLPHLGGKCQNLHGHSWWAEVTVMGPIAQETGVVVEFGPFKAELRGWIDKHLDHGTMLGSTDPLVPALSGLGSKLLVFGAEPRNTRDAYELPVPGHLQALPDELVADLAFPTVENVATLIARVATKALDMVDHDGAYVAAVEVRETHVNSATWSR